MAVFTQVSDVELCEFIQQYEKNIGEFIKLEGISGGIENTNYFLYTAKSTYVLTIFERLTFSQLPFYLELMSNLADKGICVPKPIQDINGNIINTLCSKPCTIVTKLDGVSIFSPTIDNIKDLAINVATMHIVSQEFTLKQKNLRSLDWWKETIPAIIPFINKKTADILQAELEFQENFFNSAIYKSLPKGACHCDLFRDNALFSNNKLSGIFDFYFAGVDTFLFDICVIINDWCIYRDEDNLGSINLDLYHAFIDSYQTVRRLTDNELYSINSMLRAAALRFWISRLWDWHLPRDSKLLKPHDPCHFEIILSKRIKQQIN